MLVMTGAPTVPESSGDALALPWATLLGYKGMVVILRGSPNAPSKELWAPKRRLLGALTEELGCVAMRGDLWTPGESSALGFLVLLSSIMGGTSFHMQPT